jgi:hypothetical protein
LLDEAARHGWVEGLVVGGAFARVDGADGDVCLLDAECGEFAGKLSGKVLADAGPGADDGSGLGAE